MMIQLHNTLTRRKEPFAPLDAKNVRMYVCGPTVYDYAHIGNARPVIVFDVLFRLLRLKYGEDHVTYVRNITDVDDRINEAARLQGVPIRTITERTAKAYQDDMAALGNLDPTHQPRVTDTIPEIVTMIEALIANGHAYSAEGHVLFDVPSMPDYGKLSGRSTDEMIAGARVDVAPYKKSPMDFVLWKPSDETLPGWDSPWGRGRPGWHIECSAMSKKLLGQTFDIHAGGLDLIFPHHENEIAQSECTHGGAALARYWMHNGFLSVNGQKMSKSLGNFRVAHDLLKQHPGEALRLQMLTTHYRQPIDFTDAGTLDAKATLDQWYRAAAAAGDAGPVPDTVLEALSDDLNTPKTLMLLHRYASDAAKGSNEASRSLKAAAQFLGLLQWSVEAWERWTPEGQTIDAARVEDLLSQRQAARASKNFAEADRIRAVLTGMGVVIEDTPQGPKWRAG
jgi:cysteinyl-tRNA synthetase